MYKNVLISANVYVSVSWNVQPIPPNRKVVQFIASPPFPLVQTSARTDELSLDTSLVLFTLKSYSFPEIFPKFAVHKTTMKELLR